MKRKFHGRCRQGRMTYVPLEELPAEQQAAVAVLAKPMQYPVTDEDRPAREAARAVYPLYDAKKGGYQLPVYCDLDTEDVALFEAHMADAHNQKKPATRKRSVWRAPKLSDEGRLFEPKGLEPGATVTWRELAVDGESLGYAEHLGYDRRTWVERSGQVWSAAAYPKSVWVVPFEPREGEFAVLARLDRLDGKLSHSATWTHAGYRDAA